MVSISHENAATIHDRLSRVIRAARVAFYDGSWGFDEFPLSEFQARADREALALVRDDAAWSQLLPYRGEGEQFALFRFHFPPNIDNSGFVGWLASLLKEELGTGVIVTCGSNRMDGGIFDYWGIPYSLREQGFAIVRNLCGIESTA